jgi:hypothetical protein
MRLPITLAIISVGSIPLARGLQFGGDEAPAGATLDSLVWNGDGCATESNTTWASDVDGVLSFATPSLKAVIGPDSSRRDGRSFCQFQTSVTYPAGWQYAVKRVVISGYADLMAGLTGLTKGDIYFSGDPKEVGSQLRLEGIITN